MNNFKQNVQPKFVCIVHTLCVVAHNVLASIKCAHTRTQIYMHMNKFKSYFFYISKIDICLLYLFPKHAKARSNHRYFLFHHQRQVAISLASAFACPPLSTSS